MVDAATVPVLGGAQCPKCGDTGHVVDEEARTAARCDCLPELNRRRRVSRIQRAVSHRYVDCRIDRNPVVAMPASVTGPLKKYVKDFAKHAIGPDRDGVGLWLSGGIGSGKTSAAAAVAMELSEALAGYSVDWVLTSDLLSRIRASYSDDPALMAEVEIRDELARSDLLVLDDVAAIKASDWALDQLFLIIDERYTDKRPVMFTTDFSPRDLAQQIGPRTVSRLTQMCKRLDFAGPDRRQAA